MKYIFYCDGRQCCRFRSRTGRIQNQSDPEPVGSGTGQIRIVRWIILVWHTIWTIFAIHSECPIPWWLHTYYKENCPDRNKKSCSSHVIVWTLTIGLFIDLALFMVWGAVRIRIRSRIGIKVECRIRTLIIAFWIVRHSFLLPWIIFYVY